MSGWQVVGGFEALVSKPEQIAAGLVAADQFVVGVVRGTRLSQTSRSDLKHFQGTDRVQAANGPSFGRG